MVFVLVVPFYLMGSSSWADEAEDKAVSLVEKLSGNVTRDNKAPGKPVVGVTLANPKVTDAELKELGALKNLTTLDLRFTKVTAAGLKDLQKALLNCKIITD